MTKQTALHDACATPTIVRARFAELPVIFIEHVRSGVAGEYIGGVAHGRRGSPLGSPYRIRDESVRLVVIANYEVWLRRRLADGDIDVTVEIDRLAALLQRDGRLVLLCWCEPLPCHGDVVAKIIVEVMAKTSGDVLHP